MIENFLLNNIIPIFQIENNYFFPRIYYKEFYTLKSISSHIKHIKILNEYEESFTTIEKIEKDFACNLADYLFKSDVVSETSEIRNHTSYMESLIKKISGVSIYSALFLYNYFLKLKALERAKDEVLTGYEKIWYVSKIEQLMFLHFFIINIYFLINSGYIKKEDFFKDKNNNKNLILVLKPNMIKNIPLQEVYEDFVQFYKRWNIDPVHVDIVHKIDIIKLYDIFCCETVDLNKCLNKYTNDELKNLNVYMRHFFKLHFSLLEKINFYNYLEYENLECENYSCLLLNKNYHDKKTNMVSSLQEFLSKNGISYELIQISDDYKVIKFSNKNNKSILVDSYVREIQENIINKLKTKNNEIEFFVSLQDSKFYIELEEHYQKYLKL